MPGDTLKAAEDAAREAVLKAARSFGGPNRGVHGELSEAWIIGALNNYQDVIIARKDAKHAALRAAAERMNAILWRKDLMGFDYAAEYNDAAKQLKSALDATPWEPSEEMVERHG